MNRRVTIPNLRWYIASLLFAVTLLNYIDRSSLPALIGEIQKSLTLSDQDYSRIGSLFLIAYATMYAVSGYVIDRLGTRVGMAIFVSAWSVFQILHGFCGGKWTFALCRFGLGLAEPGSFPAAVKVISEWFPPRQRALAAGVFNAGSALGAAVAVWLTATLALHYGWRAAFYITGMLGLFWVMAWLFIFGSARNHPWLGDVEKSELAELSKDPDATISPGKSSWTEILRSRPGLMVILPRLLTDPVIFFVINWLPKYLAKERGFDLQMIRDYGWIPYAFGGAGYIIGGWLSGRFMRAGRGTGQARKIAMTIGAAFLPMAILAPLVPYWWMAIGAMGVVVLGHAIWVANLMTLPADLFPPHKVATAAGLSGMGGALAGALANWYTGDIVAHFGYLPIFICAGLLHPIAVVFLWRFLPEKYFAQKN